MAVYLGNKVVNIMMNGVDGIFKFVEKTDRISYVSLGDSIAAGRGVDDRAEDSYFGLIKNKLKTMDGDSDVE